MSSIARAILTGQKIKFTLETVEQDNPGRVRLDWLRFTLPVDSFTVKSASRDFRNFGQNFVAFESGVRDEGVWLPHQATEQLARAALAVAVDAAPLPDRSCDVALRAAQELISRVGVFQLGEPEPSGMDFYSARVPVTYEGAVVGFVLAGGKSDAQASTVHFNLFGSACLHLGPGHHAAIANWIDELQGWITRTDLALDVWSGLDIVTVQQAWKDGAFDVRGKRPGQKEHGSWSSGHSRTFEVGNRGTGKLMRAYEKGDELFGHESGDPWVRLEVEFRSSHRVIETDVLRRPADYFAGAYPYCADFLASLNLQANVCRIPTHAETKDRTAEAAVTRVSRWLKNTAGPSLAAVWNLGGDLIAEIITDVQHRKPRRLQGFARETVQEAFQKVAAAIAPPVAPLAIGAGA